MAYTIKHNLPEGILNISGLKNPFCNLQRNQAVRRFYVFSKQITEKGYDHKTFIRNSFGEDIRGTIQVEIDGFFYYVELFKE